MEENCYRIFIVLERIVDMDRFMKFWYIYFKVVEYNSWIDRKFWDLLIKFGL